MKKLILIALIMAFSSSAFAKQASNNSEVITVAQSSIVNYALVRMLGIGGAFGKELTQPQICGLAGQANTGFQVLTAAGVSEEELAVLLKGLSKWQVTAEQIRSKLAADLENCT